MKFPCIHCGEYPGRIRGLHTYCKRCWINVQRNGAPPPLDIPTKKDADRATAPGPVSRYVQLKF